MRTFPPILTATALATVLAVPVHAAFIEGTGRSEVLLGQDDDSVDDALEHGLTSIKPRAGDRT